METNRLESLTKIMKQEVEAVINQSEKLIFLDEAIFSPQTLLPKTWSLKGENIRQLDIRNKIKTQALLSAISSDDGLEHYIIKQRSINQHDFVEFLEELYYKLNQVKIFLFMDNLSVHKTKLVRQKMKQLNIQPIYNVPYSPQYNGIESYFFLVKQQYKKLLLQNILKEKQINIQRMIIKSIEKVDEEKVKNCAYGGLKEIFKQIELINQD